MKKEIKAIAFDIGGVLDKAKWQDHYIPLCKEIHVPLEKFDVPFKRYFNDAQVGKLSTEKMMDLIATDLKIDPPFLLEKWIKTKKAALSEDLEVRETIIKLKKDYKIISLTNIHPLHHQLRIELGLYDLFDINIVSCLEGVCKPDMKIYSLLLQRLVPLKPEQIVFIDDKEECLAPAKKLGIHTILFKNNTQLVQELVMLGVKI